MDHADFKGLTNEEIASYIRKTSADTLQSEAPFMNSTQISIALAALDEDSDWSNKTRKLINGLTSREHLEAAGHAMSVSQILEILNHLDYKLLPILVGLPVPHFIELLVRATEKQFEILKRESISEPVQYKIAAFGHEMQKKLSEKSKELEHLNEIINDIRIDDDLSRDELKDLLSSIRELTKWIDRALQEINRVLTLAWNTNRPDLIDKLNHLKEMCLKLSEYAAGSSSIGLFARIDEKLSSVYGKEGLEDDEPSIDGIAKFSVWYLQDYWELGLLPGVGHLNELDLSSQSYPKASHREKLFNMVKSNLEQIGLATVKDLKLARIYSKRTLREYISEHRHLLKETT